MKFRQFAPISALLPIVECIWTCPELVIHFGDRFERLYADGTVERQSNLLFAGQLTGQIALRPTGVVATFGIRLCPGSAAAILHMPQPPLLGTTLGVDVLDRSLYRELSTIRDAARSLDEAVATVQRYLCSRLDDDWLDPRVLAAVEILRRGGGQIGIGMLARQVGTTRRHLERRFDALVGISPKRLARIVRFQRALRMLHARRERHGLHSRAMTGAATALARGYADQPHFIREFIALAGSPPGLHLLRHGQLTGFFTGGTP
jgi:AraC-like DNA-binding protein